MGLKERKENGYVLESLNQKTGAEKRKKRG